jgi:hypothetical protein
VSEPLYPWQWHTAGNVTFGRPAGPPAVLRSTSRRPPRLERLWSYLLASVLRQPFVSVGASHVMRAQAADNRRCLALYALGDHFDFAPSNQFRDCPVP